MGQDYDKIFKENIEEIILPLAKKVLNIDPEGLEEIPDDLQHTIERKPDFLKKVIHKNSKKDYILHIEFQVVDEPEMVYRMLEYYALLLRDYEIELKQYVFYIGKGKAKMPIEIKHKKLQFAFELINMQEIDYHQFVSSSKPEEVILAILADFGKDKPQTVIDAILENILIVTEPNLKREKTVRQLEILSKLRKLQAQIIKSLNNMALTYDIKNDIRYKEGKLEGKEEILFLTTKNMLLNDFSHQQIKKALNVTEEYIKKVSASLKNN